ncbi:MAG: hypothetical protein H6923_08430 [Alphaproteobacteria bacterium]|nr:hypothetical protein [Alphaproteobacteria bacterium]
MQFVIIARDDPAPGTLDRRMAARPEHLEGLRRLYAEGKILDGGALLDDRERMCGSVMLCEFESRAALDAYLETEPYFRDKVWKDVEIRAMRRAPLKA